MAAKERLFVGLHAGGLDGVDAALVAVRGRGEQMTFQQIDRLHAPFGRELREGLEALPCEIDASLEKLSQLDWLAAQALGGAVASLLGRAGESKEAVKAAGAFGVAIAAGIELGSAAAVARICKLPVVGRFDIADRAAGGNGGAPTAWPV
ncbi:MAG: anhydro-N-acetylmuramic acid kinase, partial [Planctomycetota bacterium]